MLIGMKAGENRIDNGESNRAFGPVQIPAPNCVSVALEGDLASELSRIAIDTRLEVYDSYDKEYHPGVVSAIHDDRAGHVCSVRYDDGPVDLDEQHFRIIDEAGGQQVNDAPRQNGGEDAPEGARQEENTTEVAEVQDMCEAAGI